MSGEAERLHEIGRPRRAHMQIAQSMKAVSQFTLDGRWGTAQRFVGLSDPFTATRTAATDFELEAALGEIKVEEDRRRRCNTVGQSPVEHNDDG